MVKISCLPGSSFCVVVVVINQNNKEGTFASSHNADTQLYVHKVKYHLLLEGEVPKGMKNEVFNNEWVLEEFYPEHK